MGHQPLGLRVDGVTLGGRATSGGLVASGPTRSPALAGYSLGMEEVAVRASGWNDAPEVTIDEPASFEEFFYDERDRLFRVMCVITGHRQEAEDLCQEAFARVWERWPTVGEMENPPGYLHRTAMNLFRSRYRRALLATRNHLGMAVQGDPFDAIDDRQVALQALASLAPRQRAAIVLTEVLLYTAEEAGSMLGIRASTVRALHFQARSALKSSGRTTDA
jgi:RNA polymerase sigma-70 factor, ECF subfamily